MKVFRAFWWLTASVCCGVASATTAPITITGTSLGQSISFLRDGTVRTGYAGGIVINANSVSSSALCVDVFTGLAINDTFQVHFYNPEVLNTSFLSRGLKAAFLYVTQYGTRTSVVTGGNPSITLNQAMAALQLAVWDIVHDGGDGFSAGRIRASTGTNATNTAVLNAAIQYVQYSINYTSGSTNATLYQHVNGPLTKQQLMGIYQPGTGIPEPGSILLMGGGLATLVVWKRKRRKY